MNFYKHLKIVPKNQIYITQFEFGPSRGRCCPPLFSVNRSETPELAFIVTYPFKPRISDYLPKTAPNQDDMFCGVNRSIDPIRLSGIRYNATGRSKVLNTIDDACVLIAREGGKADLVLIKTNPTHYQTFSNYYSSGIIIEEPTLSDNEIYVLTKSSWALGQNSDGGETLLCNAPGYNAVCFIDEGVWT